MDSSSNSNDDMPRAEAPPGKRAKRDYGVSKVWLFIISHSDHSIRDLNF